MQNGSGQGAKSANEAKKWNFEDAKWRWTWSKGNKRSKYLKLWKRKMKVDKKQRKQKNEASRMQNGGGYRIKGTNKAEKWSFHDAKSRWTWSKESKQSRELKLRGCKIEVDIEQWKQTKQRNKASRIQIEGG
jgi:hypothetical protein